MTADAPAASSARREAGRVGRFLVVGTAGFAIDAGVLALLTAGLGQGPLIGRAVSVSLAVTSTWYLNRRWSFRSLEAPSLAEFLRYVLSQAAGFAMNLVIYTALVVLAPWPWSVPITALAAASLIALVVNYLGMRLFVFGQRDRAVRP